MLRTRRQIRLWKLAICLTCGLALVYLFRPTSAPQAVVQAARFAGPTSSQPLALSADNNFLIAANPDNDSVTLFSVGGVELRLEELKVGQEPNGVALLPDRTRAYVANTVSGTVTVLAVNTGAPFLQKVTDIPVGTEPYGLALTPNGRKLYVTNSRSNSLSVINTATNQVTRTIQNVGFEPRGLAITNDGDDDDNDETVYVTQFLALPLSGKPDGEDDSKAGLVTVVSTNTDAVTATVVLRPLADAGFNALGDAIGRIAPPANPQPADFKFVTGAYPNQLHNLAIKGDFAFVPSTGASPNGPVRFDVNTQSLLSVLNRTNNQDAGRTINMHKAVEQQTNATRLFITQPWAIAFERQANEGYVVSAASNIVVKLAVNATTGAATVQSDPSDPTRVLGIRVGKNPRGIVINSADTRAYVMNYVSRDISVIDLTTAPERVTNTLRSANLPTPGTPEDMILIGKELYNTSVGEFDPPAQGQPAIVGRMSRAGWGSCATCHPYGLTDNVVWIFAAGPRRTIPQHTDFDLTDPNRRTQRALNWSAIFDEEEDFELNIRNVSGGGGLIVLDDGITADPNVAAFLPLANANRRQLKVRGVNAWDAIKAFVKFGIRPPISPVSKTEPDVIEGANIFRQNNCQQCHGGPLWSNSLIRFTPPPAANLVVNTQLVGELSKVGTFDPAAKNEVRANAAAPLGADGFASPSLLSLFAFPRTFFHNGQVDSLEGVLANVTHRSAGTGGVDLLDDAEQRRKLIRFLLSIDGRTPPIALPAVVASVSAASFSGAELASESIVAAFGAGLATATQVATSVPLPTTLAGTTVKVRDSAGVTRDAPLFFVAPTQVNYLIPAGTAAGAATVTITSGAGAISTGATQIASVAPGLFSANANGQGVAAAVVLRIKANGDRIYEAISRFDAAQQRFVAIPIDLGPATDAVYLILYGTGLRFRSALTAVTASIGGTNAGVLYAGGETGFVGLDQVNVLLPRSLIGRGEVDVVVTADGKAANTVRVAIN
jgi:uncharacterized protein (TIGR03437 family)